jgi:hypothetical protein
MSYHPIHAFKKGPIRHMDRFPIAHTGPVLALDWSSAALSTKCRAQDDGGVCHGDDGVGVVWAWREVDR